MNDITDNPPLEGNVAASGADDIAVNPALDDDDAAGTESSDRDIVENPPADS